MGPEWGPVGSWERSGTRSGEDRRYGRGELDTRSREGVAGAPWWNRRRDPERGRAGLCSRLGSGSLAGPWMRLAVAWCFTSRE